ncbi:hypothetical protein ANCCAN_09646 [Ancylostoma caninum]|uniref:Uncharacterized protein n=1 Tax=Ancylostoma caninum TaxID=29170 RepID=A0A368GM52_ANCCA|nr:hypothetical protein ANCCAN_09646 [Ancylostoma caninum]
MVFHPFGIGDPTRHFGLATQRTCTILCVLLTITQIVTYIFLPRILRYVLIAFAALVCCLVLGGIIRMHQTLLLLSLVFTTLLQVPTVLVISKTIIAESFRGEYDSIRCHVYFGEYECWLYNLCRCHFVFLFSRPSLQL